MTQGSATAAQPLAIGEHRDFPAGRVTIAVTRTADDAYRVVVLDLSGLSIPCWTAEFTPDRIPTGTTTRRATWDYVQAVAADFGADMETPAAVAQRVHALAA